MRKRGSFAGWRFRTTSHSLLGTTQSFRVS
jgi:hypothetical protein